jgi:hypothetical protein
LKGERLIIVDDGISIDIEAKRRWLLNPKSCKKTTFIKIPTHRSGFPPLLIPARSGEEGRTNLWSSRRRD